MDDCIFCKIVDGKAKSWKVYENEHAYAFLDVNPVNCPCQFAGRLYKIKLTFSRSKVLRSVAAPNKACTQLMEVVRYSDVLELITAAAAKLRP